jgi:hypothetical protein
MSANRVPWNSIVVALLFTSWFSCDACFTLNCACIIVAFDFLVL